MKIIYPYSCSLRSNQGGHIHVKQFIDNVEKLGHQVITQNGSIDRNDPGLNTGFWNKLHQISTADVIYYRVEEKSPKDRLHYSFVKNLVNNPVIVWELNTVPEYAMLSGVVDQDISSEKYKFRIAAKQCDLAICVSRELARYAKEEFRIKNVCYVPNGSDPDKFSNNLQPVPRIPSSPDILNVVWIGNAGIGWHDFDVMRRAAIHLCNQGYQSKISFHVIGNGMGSMSDIPLNISYYGAEDYDELPRWLAAMDVGLVLYQDGPAYYNSPLKLFDYMASGLSIVGTAQPQVKDILSEIGCENLLIPIGDYKCLAAKLIWLLHNKNKVKLYGESARKLLIEKYTWKNNVTTIVNEIQKCQGG